MRTQLAGFLALGGFGLACVIGLVGAFVGLGVSSFWLDELYTAWVVGADHDLAAFVARASGDVNPPVYYGLLYVFSQAAGACDVCLRSLSAICACAAVLIFTLGTGRAFSTQGRLFAGAVATGSLFWFYQSQNARSYSLSMAIGAALLALCLSQVEDHKRGAAPGISSLLALFALLLAGAFTHFYVAYEALAICLVMAVCAPTRRWTYLAMFAAIGAAVAAYVKFVVLRFSRTPTTQNWIRGDLGWYRKELFSAVHLTIDKLAVVAVSLCVAAVILTLILDARRSGGVCRWQGQTADKAGGDTGQLSTLRKVSPSLMLCFGVPILVTIQGVASSTVVSPNLTDRNLLVCSPFVWGLLTCLYDGGVQRLSEPLRVVAVVALSGLVLATSTIASSRLLPRNEPFRETAEWIRTLPACHGSEIPVVDMDKLAWGGDGQEGVARLASFYGRYLNGYARPRVIALEDIMPDRLPPDLKREIQDRIAGRGCPVVAWSAHDITSQQEGSLAQALLAATDRSAASPTLRVRRFRVYKHGLTHDYSWPLGFVFYIAR